MDLTALEKQARNKATSATRLLELAKLDPWLSRAIAKRAAPLPAEVFEALAHHSDMQTQRAIAAHPKAPVKLLEYLSEHEQWTVLKTVAENPNTPNHVLDILSRHQHHTVRESVAQRKDLPEEMVERFCTDPDPLVRHTMIRHPQTSREQLERFLTDSNAGVRTTLASLHKPRTFANDLLTDPEPQVRREASVHAEYSALKSRLPRLIQDPAQGVRIQVASRCRRPELLAVLVSDPSDEVRYQVAHNPFTPDEALCILAEDANTLVQYALCHNPITPPLALQRLAEVIPLVQTIRYNTHPFWALIENPSTPPEALRLLRQRSLPHFDIFNARIKNPNWPADLQVKLYCSDHDITHHQKKSDETPQVRADWKEFVGIKDTLPPQQVLAWMLNCSIYTHKEAAASSRYTPSGAILRFVLDGNHDEFRFIYLNIAKNPATPLAVLQNMVITHASHLLRNPFLPDSLLDTLAYHNAKGGETWWHPYMQSAKCQLRVRQAKGIRVDDQGNISRPQVKQPLI